MRTRLISVIGATLVLAGAVAGGVALRSGGGPGEPDEIAKPAVVDIPSTEKRLTAIREPDTTTLGAVANGPEVPLYDTDTSTVSKFALPNPTHENVPLTFSIMERSGDRYHVRIPIRPNGATAWIDVDDVTAHLVSKHIVVDISDRRLTLFEGERVLMEESVSVGSDATPTPLGDFYVDISLPDPGGPYGEHMLSVAGFSDVLTDFGGGIGQIAIHGWNDPSAMGHAVSNGCVRMTNGTIAELAGHTGVGTPVHIQA